MRYKCSCCAEFGSVEGSARHDLTNFERQGFIDSCTALKTIFDHFWNFVNSSAIRHTESKEV